MEAKKRLTYIDWAKAIAITLIVAGHFLPSGSYPKVLMYSFHVPIFALLGGMLAKPADSFKAYGKKIGSLCLRLLVPYTIWFIIFAIPHFYPVEEIPKVVKTHLELTEVIKRYFFLENESIWNAAMWFLPSYFIISVLGNLYLKLTKGKRLFSLGLSAVLFTVLLVMENKGITLDLFGIKNIMSVRNILILFGTYMLGYASRGVMDAIIGFKEKGYANPFPYLGIVVFVVATLILMPTLKDTNPKNYAGYYTLSLYSGRYRDMNTFLPFALILSFSLTLACGLLPECKLATLFSKNSFFIMLTHYVFFLFETFLQLAKKQWYLDLRQSLRDIVFILVVYAIILYFLDKLITRFPKTKPFFRFIGIQ